MVTLRIGGKRLDPDALLRAVPLVAAAIHRLDDRPRQSLQRTAPADVTASLNVAVSEADATELPRQIADAIAFLSSNFESLRSVGHFPGVEALELDFLIARRDVALQSDAFPLELLRPMAGLGLSLVVSSVPAFDDGEA